MNKKKYVEALEHICEESNGCDNCPIAKSKYGVAYCRSHQFENMDEADLILYAEAAGLNISDEDPVNRASHYNQGGIECIDALEASMSPIEYAGLLKGQVFKYIWRYRHKGKATEDLKKAFYYLERLIRITEREEEKEK